VAVKAVYNSSSKGVQMPIAPNQKPVRPPLPEFKPMRKKSWDPPNRQTYTVESLAAELDTLRMQLITIAEHIVLDAQKLEVTKNELLGSSRHLESIYHRLINHGIMSRQPADTITVYRADDIPF
jgi:hypothetical protein